MASSSVQADLARAARHVRPGLHRDHQGHSPRRSLTERKRRDRRPQQPRPHHHRASAAVVTSSATASSTSSATRSACRPRSRRSSTTRTARRASRSCTTPTARSATSSPRRPEGRRHGDLVEPQRRHQARQLRCRSGSSRSARRSTTSSCKIGGGAQIVRSAGAGAQLMAKEGDWAQVRLPSGEVRRVHLDCRATIGQVGNIEHANIHVRQGRPYALARAAARTTAASR